MGEISRRNICKAKTLGKGSYEAAAGWVTATAELLYVATNEKS